MIPIFMLLLLSYLQGDISLGQGDLFCQVRKFPTSQTMGALVMYLSIPVQVYACAYTWVCVYKQLTTSSHTHYFIPFNCEYTQTS